MGQRGFISIRKRIEKEICMGEEWYFQNTTNWVPSGFPLGSLWVPSGSLWVPSGSLWISSGFPPRFPPGFLLGSSLGSRLGRLVVQVAQVA